MDLREEHTQCTLKPGLTVQSVRPTATHCKETALELMIPRESFLEEDLDMGLEGKGKGMLTIM